jgi:hypothetical protein
VAVPVAVPLVAVIVTLVCAGLIGLGGVYTPELEIWPSPAGLIVHATGALLVPVTVAVNCVVCHASNVEVVGDTETEGACTAGFSMAITLPPSRMYSLLGVCCAQALVRCNSMAMLANHLGPPQADLFEFRRYS